MRTRTRGDGFIMSVDPSRVVIRQRLSNGQYMTLRFYRHRTKVLDGVPYCWKVSLYIGDMKGADRWNRGKGKDSGKQTGTGSIEGLRMAMHHTLSFAKGFVGTNSELQIDFEDEKRARVYMWLLRYPGFNGYEDDAGKLFCIAYRDPDYWNYDDTKKGAGA